MWSPRPPVVSASVKLSSYSEDQGRQADLLQEVGAIRELLDNLDARFGSMEKQHHRDMLSLRRLISKAIATRKPKKSAKKA